MFLEVRAFFFSRRHEVGQTTIDRVWLLRVGLPIHVETECAVLDGDFFSLVTRQ